jgi:hypothetical protein
MICLRASSARLHNDVSITEEVSRARLLNLHHDGSGDQHAAAHQYPGNIGRQKLSPERARSPTRDLDPDHAQHQHRRGFECPESARHDPHRAEQARDHRADEHAADGTRYAQRPNDYPDRRGIEEHDRTLKGDRFGDVRRGPTR